MKVIINGDDYGLTLGVSKGIIEAIKDGMMTDTTAMANMPAFEESIKYAMDNGIKEMGVHLTLTCGKPLTNSPSLVDETGNMSKKIYENGTYDIDEVEKELREQIKKFISTGMKLNHIDGHHHMFALVPAVFNIVIKLAKEYKVPMRCPYNRDLPLYKKEGIVCPDHMIEDFYAEDATEEHLKERLLECKQKGLTVVEVMSHPAYIDEELQKLSSYLKYREEELRILTSDSFKKFISENNIEMISFSSI